MSGEDLENRGAKNRGSTSNSGGYSSSYAAIDDGSTRWTSWLIPVFVVANVAMFIVTMYVNNCPKNNIGFDGKCVARFLGRLSFQPLRENPLFGPSSSTWVRKKSKGEDSERTEELEIYSSPAVSVTHDGVPDIQALSTIYEYGNTERLEKLGALEWSKVVHKHQGWRLFSCMWLHAGIIHILANMLSLVFIGVRLEQQFGFVRIGIIYLISGLGGSVLSTLFIRSNISVGASGALFGLLGAMLSELLTNWTIYSNKAAALLTLVVIVAINLAVGILPHVDNFAHIGGFLTGFLLGFIFLPRPQFGWVQRRNLPADVRVRSKYKPYQYALWLIAFVLLVSGFTVGLVMLFRGVNGNDHCDWCHYLSCVPTSRWKCDNF